MVAPQYRAIMTPHRTGVNSVSKVPGPLGLPRSNESNASEACLRLAQPQDPHHVPAENIRLVLLAQALHGLDTGRSGGERRRRMRVVAAAEARKPPRRALGS